MKLQYRETKWVDAETGIEIAPQDQKYVDAYIELGNHHITIDSKWNPDPSKLYDSGDLVFELKYVDICPIAECGEKSNKCVMRGKFEVCKCHTYEAWVLKEVKTVNSIRAEMPEKLKEAYNVPSLRQLCWRIDREIWANVEAHEATQSWGREQTGLLILDFLKEIQTEESKTIKQLQSHIAELEEQRERLIAKLMNAEDKLKELDVSDQEQLINDLSDIANDYKNNDEYHYDREGFIKEIKSKFVVRIKESN